MLDRFKMDKRAAWNNKSIAAVKFLSMPMKGQMKQTFKVTLTASQAGKNTQKSQRNVPKHTIIFSILIDPIHKRRAACLNPLLNQ